MNKPRYFFAPYSLKFLASISTKRDWVLRFMNNFSGEQSHVILFLFWMFFSLVVSYRTTHILAISSLYIWIFEIQLLHVPIRSWFEFFFTSSVLTNSTSFVNSFRFVITYSGHFFSKVHWKPKVLHSRAVNINMAKEYRNCKTSIPEKEAGQENVDSKYQYKFFFLRNQITLLKRLQDSLMI